MLFCSSALLSRAPTLYPYAPLSHFYLLGAHLEHSFSYFLPLRFFIFHVQQQQLSF